MASGRKGKPLTTRRKGNAKAGGKWKHGFKPKNAVARQLKRKTYKTKGKRRRTRTSKRRGGR